MEDALQAKLKKRKIVLIFMWESIYKEKKQAENRLVEIIL